MGRNIKTRSKFTNWVAPTFGNFLYEMKNEEPELCKLPEVLQELYQTAKIVTICEQDIRKMQMGEGNIPPREWLSEPGQAPEDVDPSEFRYHVAHHEKGQILDRFKKNDPLFIFRRVRPLALAMGI